MPIGACGFTSLWEARYKQNRNRRWSLGSLANFILCQERLLHKSSNPARILLLCHHSVWLGLLHRFLHIYFLLIFLEKQKTDGKPIGFLLKVHRPFSIRALWTLVAFKCFPKLKNRAAQVRWSLVNISNFDSLYHESRSQSRLFKPLNCSNTGLKTPIFNNPRHRQGIQESRAQRKR